MRSLLFVPGDSERKLEKGPESGADALIVDLEDSVSPARKEVARRLAAGFLDARRARHAQQVYVRINDLRSGLAEDDLAAVMPFAPDGVMLPKSAGHADIVELSGKLRAREAAAGLAGGGTKILAIMTETATGVLAAGTYRRDNRLAGLTWGAEDLSAAIGAHSARDEAGRLTDVFRLARALTILAASAAEALAIDAIHPDFRDLDGLRRTSIEAARDGFAGKMAIHPAQVPVINEVFTPSSEIVAHSRMVVDAFEAAGRPGVLAIDGRMYDRPHLVLAERLLARARLAGASE